MQPRVIILAKTESKLANNIIEALRLIGISTFYREKDLLELSENSLSLLEEELDRTHAAILVIEPSYQQSDFAYTVNLLRPEIEIVLQHHSRNPLLAIIPVVETRLTKAIPEELRKFQRIYFTEWLKPSDLRLIVDKTLDAWHLLEHKGVLPLDQLIAEASILVPRLNLIISQTRTMDVIALVIALIAAVLGIALSIPSILIYWSLPEYWLFIGPIIFIAGGLATIDLFIKERWERRRIKVASFIESELKDLLERIESLRQHKRSLQLEK
ncbi:MAG: TIR domain-containing protein [Pyrinomonadaceae bacterium]|nr:TIR domain-containing protein [Pyrinomonadaceae bacterium]